MITAVKENKGFILFFILAISFMAYLLVAIFQTFIVIKPSAEILDSNITVNEYQGKKTIRCSYKVKVFSELKGEMHGVVIPTHPKDSYRLSEISINLPEGEHLVTNDIQVPNLIYGKTCIYFKYIWKPSFSWSTKYYNLKPICIYI